MNKTHLPKGWKLVTLGEISKNFISGGTPSTLDSSFWEGDIPWVRSAWLKEKYVEKGERTITLEGLDNSSSNIVPKNNLLVATRVSLGNVAINKVDVAINQDLTGVILDKSKVSEEFVYFSFINDPTKITSHAQGSTIQGITRRQLETVLILLPPVNEQQKIASILSNVDSLIQQTQKELEQTHSFKNGLVKKLLARGIGHTRFKKVKSLSDKYEEIPEEWELNSLGNLCEIRKENSINSNLYVGLEHIGQGTNSLVGKGDVKQFTSTKNIFKKGDVLYGKLRPLLNKVWLATEDGFCSTDILPIKTKQELDNKILEKIISSEDFINYALSFSSGTKMPRTNWSDISKYEIKLPPILEQQKIASILSNVDSKIQIQQEYKSKLENLKKGLMQKLLTGQIRVKV